MKQRTNESRVSTPILTVDPDESVEDRLTENAIHRILPARYLIKDGDGNPIESPEEMFCRVASDVASVEEPHLQEMWEDRFFEIMSTLQFIPNSPTMMNAGTAFQQLSACFVVSPDDDLHNIYETVKEAAQIFQTGGGVGYSFSALRPKGHRISTTKGTASGPVSFMESFDAMCNTIKQGGRRRGAQMAILRVDHPDVLRFIRSKTVEGKLSNFNISVAITDEFIEAINHDTTYTMLDPTTDFKAPYTSTETTARLYGVEVGETLEVPARDVWDAIIDGAWSNGEPGLFYIDETNRMHTFDVEEYPEYEIRATNPCGEQPLVEHEACNLGHINLSLMLLDSAVTYDEWREHRAESPDPTLGQYLNSTVDQARLRQVTRYGVRFLDNVVDRSHFPLESIEETVDELRKIGLGVMGFAQMLFQMGIPYGSEESFEVAEWIMAEIDYWATWYSHELAREKGSFPAWKKSKYANPMRYEGWFTKHTQASPIIFHSGFEMRNHNVTTVAPTGTTSMIANTTGGIEPAFSVVYKHNAAEDMGTMIQFDSYFKRTLEYNGIDVDEVRDRAIELIDAGRFNSVHDLPIPTELADIFVTAEDVTPKEHVRMQRTFQSHVDSGISKTINLPNSASRDDVAEAYWYALKRDGPGSPVKGMTVYRDGSREEQVMEK